MKKLLFMATLGVAIVGMSTFQASAAWSLFGPTKAEAILTDVDKSKNSAKAAIEKVAEHDEVTVEKIGGGQGGSKGSMVGIKFKVSKINGIALSEILSGRKAKPTR